MKSYRLNTSSALLMLKSSSTVFAGENVLHSMAIPAIAILGSRSYLLHAVNSNRKHVNRRIPEDSSLQEDNKDIRFPENNMIPEDIRFPEDKRTSEGERFLVAGSITPASACKLEAAGMNIFFFITDNDLFDANYYIQM